MALCLILWHKDIALSPMRRHVTYIWTYLKYSLQTQLVRPPKQHFDNNLVCMLCRVFSRACTNHTIAWVFLHNDIWHGYTQVALSCKYLTNLRNEFTPHDRNEHQPNIIWNIVLWVVSSMFVSWFKVITWCETYCISFKLRWHFISSVKIATGFRLALFQEAPSHYLNQRRTYFADEYMGNSALYEFNVYIQMRYN